MASVLQKIEIQKKTEALRGYTHTTQYIYMIAVYIRSSQHLHWLEIAI